MPRPTLNLAPLLSGVALVTLAIVAGTLVIGSTSWRVGEGAFVTTLGLGLVAGSSLISWGVAPNTGGGHWAAVGTVTAALWTFAVAFAQYFSTCRWVSWLDLALVFVGSVLALARIYRIRPDLALLRFTLPLALSLAVGHLYGVVARGILDDPTM